MLGIEPGALDKLGHELCCILPVSGLGVKQALSPFGMRSVCAECVCRLILFKWLNVVPRCGQSVMYLPTLQLMDICPQAQTWKLVFLLYALSFSTVRERGLLLPLFVAPGFVYYK